MWTVDLNGIEIGVVGMAVGALFAVLVAEQLAASGAGLVMSITSAGQISAVDKLPCFVLIDDRLRQRLSGAFDHLPEPVLPGSSWTADAPYRETACAIEAAKQDNIACVEMEAASLSAYTAARNQAVVCFAHITNAMATTGADFEKASTTAHTTLWLLLVSPPHSSSHAGPRLMRSINRPRSALGIIAVVHPGAQRTAPKPAVDTCSRSGCRRHRCCALAPNRAKLYTHHRFPRSAKYGTSRLRPQPRQDQRPSRHDRHDYPADCTGSATTPAGRIHGTSFFRST